jgi:colanic acid biosynthesis glycosyl transferase WcaI
MRILVVSQYFAPEGFKINDLVKNLHARGHEIEVLTGMPNYPQGKFFKGYGIFKKWSEVFEGARVIRSPIWPRFRGGALHLSLNYLSYVFSAIVFGLPRVSGRFDFSFAFAVSPITSCLPAIVYKWLTGTPVVIWVQDLWPESVRAVGAIQNKFLLGLLESLVRMIYRNCDLILIQSEGFRADVTRRCDDPSKIHYFPNWAEDLYKPVDRTAVVGPAKNLPSGFKVVFAGNIGKAQSMDTLIEAATILREHKDLHWIVVGDGTERANTQSQVRDLGLEGVIHFTGRLPTEAMPEYFAMSDALIVLLKTEPIFSYTIPSRVQSYFACGRPIVAALDGEGQRVIRESGGGLVGATEDAQALANNVLSLYRMSEQDRTHMGNRGLEYYRTNFDRSGLLTQLESLLEPLKQKS